MEVANKVSDAMDHRLWTLRRFVEQLQQTGKVSAAENERKAYREAVAEWNVNLNKHRILIRRYFGEGLSDEFMNTVHNQGFGKLHEALNQILYTPNLDQARIKEEKDAIDAFNPTAYFFDDKLLELIQKERTAGCISR